MELRAHLPALIRVVVGAGLVLAAVGRPVSAADAPTPATPPPAPASPAAPGTKAVPVPAATNPPAAVPAPAPAPSTNPPPTVAATTPPAPATNLPPAAATPPVSAVAAPAVPAVPAVPAPRPALVAATVRTSGGSTLTGAVFFGPEGITVQRAGSDPVRVSLDELVEVSAADAGELPASAAGTASGVAGTNGPAGAASLPPVVGWNASPLGSAPDGKFASEGNGWVVSGAGSGLRANSDSAFFVERRLDVSGQMTATLRSFDGRHPEAMAGLMLRDNLGDAAAYAFLGQRTGQGICFQYRQIASGMTMRHTNLVLPLPVSLRLERLGGSVVAEVSTDGRQWMPLGRANVNLGQNIRAGTVVTSGTEDLVATASFGTPALGAVGLGYSPATGYPRIVLRGGSVLVAPVESADESVLRLGGALRGSPVSVLNLARIEFLPLPPELAARLEPDRPGVLLTDGDFLDGKLRGVATNTVTVNSLLFGFRRFSVGNEAAVVQAGPVEVEEAAFRLFLRQGSELRARRLTLGTNELRVESPLLGTLTVRGEEVRSLRRGGRER